MVEQRSPKPLVACSNRVSPAKREPHLCGFHVRGVAQVARVLAWGARGRKFKSCHSDHKLKKESLAVLFLVLGNLYPKLP